VMCCGVCCGFNVQRYVLGKDGDQVDVKVWTTEEKLTFHILSEHRCLAV
jgi:hypothetical protein